MGEAGLSGSKLSVKMESEMLKDDKNKNPPKQQIQALDQGPENKYFDLRKIEANNWPQLLPKKLSTCSCHFKQELVNMGSIWHFSRILYFLQIL